jgi:uncharacterized protein YecT (DUF1311 family)
MRNSKLFTVVIVAALLFANVACACAPSDMYSEPPAHHHANSQDDNESTPCVDQDCDGCDELLNRCTTADYSVASADRDARTLPPKNIEVDGPDLDLAFLDTGQAWGSLPPYTGSQPHPARVPWVTDTPIIRKDQLTE